MADYGHIPGGGRPYGDIFHVTTQHVDELAKQIYAEQRQRELYKQQQQKELDDNFSKELAGVKKVDIPEVVNAWGAYKQATIENYRRGNKSTPQDRYKLLELRADVERQIAASKEDKELIKNYQAGIKGDTKRRFDPNAAKTVTGWLNTPTSQRTQDNDQDALMYKYAFPDLGKVLKDARGSMDKEVRIGQNKDDKFSDDVEVYSKISNPPNDLYNNLFAQVAPRSDHDNYARVMRDKYTDEELEKLKTDYFAKINDPKFIQVYGETKPFPESAGKTETGQAVAIQVMEDVVNTPLKPSKTIKVSNREGLLANQQEFQIAQQKRGADFAMERVMAMFNFKRTVENEDDFKGIAGILNNTKDIIESGEPDISLFGLNKDIVSISDFNVLKTFSNIKDYPPNEVAFDKKKDKFIVRYHAKDWVDKDNNPHSLPAETVELSARDYLRLKVDEMNPKNKGKTNANIDKIITESGGLFPALKKIFSPDAVNQGKSKITSSEMRTHKLGDNEITEDQLKKGAAKYKMSVDQYKKSIGL